MVSQPTFLEKNYDCENHNAGCAPVTHDKCLACKKFKFVLI